MTFRRAMFRPLLENRDLLISQTARIPELSITRLGFPGFQGGMTRAFVTVAMSDARFAVS